MLPFTLPKISQHSTAPRWDGGQFIVGDEQKPVLEYSENFAGWSDDLTSLHEEIAGDSHSIDCASRHDAIQQIRKAITTTHPVLMEIGCSSGFLLHEMKLSFPEAIIIGADVVKAPLYRLAKKLPGIPLIRFDLLQSKLPNQIIDVLVMINVLEHIKNDNEALKKAFNLLKPGGSLVIEVPAGPYLYDAYDRELQHFRRYATSELQEKLTKIGFEISRKSHLGCIVFPVFALTKLLNKFFSRSNKKDIVRKRITKTSENYLLKIAMKFELNMLSNRSLPFGIRVLMTAKKPL